MRRVRVIPVLSCDRNRLVKTLRFSKPVYVGDPINAIKIFNDKQVDELVITDITATKQSREPNYDLIAQVASECFMPVGYGGAIDSVEKADKIFKLGIEKVIINSAALKENLISDIAKKYGSQSVVASIDYKKDLFGRNRVYIQDGSKKTSFEVVEYAKMVEDLGAGEIFLNSMANDGMMCGYDLDMLKNVSEAVDVPVICCGGGSRVEDFKEAVEKGAASAVSAGSLFVFKGSRNSVLINYPSQEDLKEKLFKFL